MKKPTLPDFLIPALGIVVLLVSIVISKAYDLLGLPRVAIGTGVVAVIVLILGSIAVGFAANIHRQEIDTVLQHLESIIPPTGFDWLLSDSDLAAAEAHARGDQIWIVSPDLRNVTGQGVISDAVKSNVKRGITYTYIVPKSDVVQGLLPGLRQVFKSNPKRLRLVQLPENEFRLLSVTHVAVFNATLVGGQAPEVFLELPIEDKEGTRDRGYWIQVAHEAALGFTGRFRRIAEAAEVDSGGAGHR